MGRVSRWGNALYEGRRQIDFVGKRYLWYAVSAVIVVIALSGLFTKGLNLGIEFEGGVEYRVSLPAAQVDQAHVEQIRDAVAGSGLEAASAPVVTTSGTDTILVQTEPLDNDQATELTGIIKDAANVGAADVSSSSIGATWGSQVANRAVLGLVVFSGLVVLFIWAYFRQWKMSLAAMVALAHDVAITVGVYALSGFEVSPATVTGVLTILGYSLYDTVVVFDKVRENTKDLRATRLTYREGANLAVNQTLVRSINTTLVALLPVAAILYVGVVSLGSGALKDLALSLFVGMAAGAYSSIFIATPLLVQLKMREKELTVAEARAKARRRHDADRYARVPTAVGGSDDGPVLSGGREPRAASFEPDEEDPEDSGHGDGREEDAPGQAGTPRPMPRRPASGSGRVAPTAHRTVQDSASAKRVQPSRKPRSKRGRR